MAEQLNEHMDSNGMDSQTEKTGRKKTGKGRGKLGMLGTAMSLGFIGYETKMNVDDGDGLIMGAGKALATNALYAAIPGGLPAALALGAAASLPDIYGSIDGKMRDNSGRGLMFGGEFQHTEASMIMDQIGDARRGQARMEASKAMTAHTAQYARYY